MPDEAHHEYGEEAADTARWEFHLFVAGQTPKSLTAFANLKKICENNLSGRYRIEVVDLLRQPRHARAEQVVVTPTLIRCSPLPIVRMVGDLSNSARVLAGLDIRELATKTCH